MKISFTGDLTCDLPLLKAAKQNGGYEFDKVFSQVSGLLKESQFVVSNLETTFSEKGHYNQKAYCYNSPEEFLDAAVRAGINIFSVANNHCCDGGLEGLERTIEVLDERKLRYLGYEGNSHVIEENGKRITLLAYTYGINNNGYALGQIEEKIGLLRPYNGQGNRGLKKLCPISMRRRIRKTMRILIGKATLEKSVDSYPLHLEYCEKACNEIRQAKKESDYVVVYPHMGGQFNTEIGSFSRQMAERFAMAGADLIIGNHAHIVQRFEYITTPVFYCLGGLSISPSASYLISDDMPQYSVITHLYIENEKYYMTFSIVKCVENRKGYLVIWPTDRLYSMLNSEWEQRRLVKECAKIYSRLLGTETEWKNFQIKREYEIGEVLSNE